MIRIACFFAALALVAGCKAKNNRQAPAETSERINADAPNQPARLASPPAPAPQKPSLHEPIEAATTKALRASIEAWSAEQAAPTDLVAKNFRPWLHSTFGPELGAKLERDEASIRTEAASFPRTIRYHASAHNRRKIVIEKFSNDTDPGATGYQSATLAAMVNPTPLYSVRFVAPSSSGELHLHNFVHDGTRFRYVGRLNKVVDANASSTKRLSFRQRDASE